ncbi:MAG TPA: BlaI/MecI/CopY family transcriptional regulator [Streptosporangiaceae bacterium]|nr:BlaI/MecI/CopY family transcriptional regulator [Streptosporangiaceae bacterium]
MARRSADPLKRALALLGPLERRIMHVAWTQPVSEPFVVHDVHAHMSELAYTTVMSTMNRLEEKGVLTSRHEKGVRAHKYSVAMSPVEFLDQAGRRQVREVVDRFGEVALAAFEAHLQGLTAEERDRLRQLGGR